MIHKRSPSNETEEALIIFIDPIPIPITHRIGVSIDSIPGNSLNNISIVSLYIINAIPPMIVKMIPIAPFNITIALEVKCLTSLINNALNIEFSFIGFSTYLIFFVFG